MTSAYYHQESGDIVLDLDKAAATLSGPDEDGNPAVLVEKAVEGSALGQYTVIVDAAAEKAAAEKAAEDDAKKKK